MPVHVTETVISRRLFTGDDGGGPQRGKSAEASSRAKTPSALARLLLPLHCMSSRGYEGSLSRYVATCLLISLFS